MNPTEERRVQGRALSVIQWGTPAPKNTARRHFSGGVSRCSLPPVFCSWWIPTWLRGLEMLSPKSPTSLGHWLTGRPACGRPGKSLQWIPHPAPEAGPWKAGGALASCVLPGAKQGRASPDYVCTMFITYSVSYLQQILNSKLISPVTCNSCQSHFLWLGGVF